MLSRTQRLFIMIALTGAFFVVELVVGQISKSLSLVADSFHMLSDLVSMIVGVVAIWIASRPKTRQLTFGWRRAEVVGSLINSIALLALCFSIAVDAIERFFEPKEVKNPQTVLIVAGIGLGINLFALVLFCGHGGHSHSHGDSHIDEDDGKGKSHAHKDEVDDAHSKHSNSSHQGKSAHDGHSHNDEVDHDDEGKIGLDHVHDDGHGPEEKHDRGGSAMYSVFLHVLGDALGSIAVIVSTCLVWLTDWSWRRYIDPVTSLIVVAILVYGSAGLAKRMILVVMQSTPPSLSAQKIEEKVRKINGVVDVHDIHLWSLDESRMIATVHVVCQDMSCFKQISTDITALLHRSGVHSTTVQPEFDQIHDDAAVPVLAGSCRATCASPECSDLRCCSPDLIQRRAIKKDHSVV